MKRIVDWVAAFWYVLGLVALPELHWRFWVSDDWAWVKRRDARHRAKMDAHMERMRENLLVAARSGGKG